MIYPTERFLIVTVMIKSNQINQILRSSDCMKKYNPEAFDMECFFAKVKKGEYKNDRKRRSGTGRNQTEGKYPESIFKEGI